MTRILISGTTGHVGSIVMQELQSSCDIIRLVRHNNYDQRCDNIISYQEICDLSTDNLIKKLGGASTFIHIASEIDFSSTNHELTSFNIATFHLLLIKLKSLNLQKVILISGAHLVGHKQGLTIHEKMQELPSSLYHFSKYAQEKILEYMNFSFYYSLRISSPISPYLKRKSIFKVFVDNALNGNPIEISGKGTRVQNYVDVRDIARLCDTLITQKYQSGTYNICSGASISNIELAKTIIEVTRSSSEIVFNGIDPLDDEAWVFDTKMAKELLHFQCMYSLKDTIVDYMREKQK
jgi:UDP-glucose 4-epimerase